MAEPLPPPAPPEPPTYIHKPRLDGGRDLSWPIALLVFVSIVVGLLLPIAAISYAATGRVPHIYTDPGLRACEGLRDHRQIAEDEQGVRKLFASSRYSDIRDAGTKAMDLVNQMGSMGQDNALGTALVMGGPLMEAYSQLSGACANHGVEIPPLGGR